MNSIYSQLKIIERRPEIYLGGDYLHALGIFLNGFVLCDNELTNAKYKIWYEGLLKYIYAYYHVNNKNSLKIWMNVIEDNSNSKKDACLTFFHILDDYTQQVGLADDSCDDASNAVTDVLNASDLQERKIQQNPLYYLQDCSVKSLSLFMFGYNMRKNMVNNTSYTCEEDFFHFIFDYFSVDQANTWKNWIMILEENTQSDEEAFHLYFKILDEYILEKNKGLYRKLGDVHSPNIANVFSIYETHPRRIVNNGHYILIKFNEIDRITRFLVDNHSVPMELTGVSWQGHNAPTITVHGKYCGDITFQIEKEYETWITTIIQGDNNKGE